MKKNASVLLALTGILFLFGCKQITNIPAGRPSIENPLEDTWTAITEDNILNEIHKYHGRFTNETGIGGLVFDSVRNEIGSGENEEQIAKRLPALEYMKYYVVRGLHLFGNGGSKLKLIDTALNIEVILTKETWTEFTPENILSEMGKYYGKFKENAHIDGMPCYLVADAINKTIGGGETLEEANQSQDDPVKTINDFAKKGFTISGNEGNRIKMFGRANNIFYEVIYTRY